jgi:SOS response regulatory protein OraA/RecX
MFWFHQELRKRGVAQDDVEKALHKVFQSQEPGNREEDEDEEGRWGMTKDASEHLLLQARRQWGRGGNISNEARKRRMIGWLQRRGFSWSVVSEILKSLERK